MIKMTRTRINSEDQQPIDQVLSAITVLKDLSIFSDFGKEIIASPKSLNESIKKDYDIAFKHKLSLF